MTEPERKRTNDLIRKAQKGDTESFQLLVQEHDQKVLGLARQMLGNLQDTEDVYQEVFMRVYKKIHTFRFQSTFETWLYRIVVNTAINYRKTRNKHLNRTWIADDQTDDTSWTPADENPLPDELTINQEIQDQIQEAMDRLTVIQRTIFLLRFYQDFKIKDIAEIISCSEGTVKNTLFRSTQKIRRYLLKYMHER
ncbi:RNA polymerase sigma factor [bacterium]|nr:RNA polymerase sigma factor [bacterium]